MPDPSPSGSADRTHVGIELDRATLEGELLRPGAPRGFIVFAHGSGSSRHSLRNQRVAQGLVRAGFATLLFDLLTEAEGGDRRHVFDIEVLTARLRLAVEQVRRSTDLAAVPVGLFGASTGAAAAIDAAAALGPTVGAVVSRGGRPDLSQHAGDLDAPVLLIVGSEDPSVRELNEGMLPRFGGDAELAVVEGAGHLFEGPGELDEVTALARGWFERHLDRGPGRAADPAGADHL